MSEMTLQDEPQQRSWVGLRDVVIVALLAVLVVCVAGVAAWVVRAPRLKQERELAALKMEVELFQEYRSLRASEADAAAWGAFENRLAKELPPIVKGLEQITAVNRPAAQKLFWVAKYRLPEMLKTCGSEPCPVEEDARRMIMESAVILKSDLPADWAQ